MALVGYVAVYKGILDTRDTEGISRFVFNIAIPALLFNSLAHVELPAQFNWKFRHGSRRLEMRRLAP